MNLKALENNFGTQKKIIKSKQMVKEYKFVNYVF